MTVRDRAQGLVALGMAPRLAEFVALAALVGGYATRRQYAAFTSRALGATVRAALDSLVTRGWATRTRLRADRAHAYHFHARPLYAALGDEDNRHRRPRPPVHIARRLMLLDAVLGDRGRDWYATEADKVALFADRWDVPATVLPHNVYAATEASDARQTRRAFVDKLPIGVAGHPPVVTFLYLVSDASGQAFARWCATYMSLWRHLPRVVVRVVYPPTVFAEAAHTRAFGSVMMPSGRPASTVTDADRAWYQRTREALDAEALGELTAADLARFQGLTRAHAAELTLLPASAPQTCSLEHHRVQASYDAFGTLPGIA